MWYCRHLNDRQLLVELFLFVEISSWKKIAEQPKIDRLTCVTYQNSQSN